MAIPPPVVAERVRICCKIIKKNKENNIKHGTDITVCTDSPSIASCSDFTDRSSLTGGEAAPEEHVEEVFGSDVGLETPVEVKASSVRVSGAARLLSSRQVILLSFVWVAQHRVRVTNLWKDRQTA